ncbi:hypothetical protein AB9F39_35030, partial [Rhizobium leguminosarum]
MTLNDPIKHFFIWPALLILLVISIFPLIYSLTTSFMSLRLVPPIPARFVGFGNYTELLQNPRFWNVAGHPTVERQCLEKTDDILQRHREKSDDRRRPGDIP